MKMPSSNKKEKRKMTFFYFFPACLTEIIYIWVCFGSPLSLHKLYLCCWVQSAVYYTVSCDSRINDLEHDIQFFFGGGSGDGGRGKELSCTGLVIIRLVCVKFSSS